MPLTLLVSQKPKKPTSVAKQGSTKLLLSTSHTRRTCCIFFCKLAAIYMLSWYSASLWSSLADLTSTQEKTAVVFEGVGHVVYQAVCIGLRSRGMACGRKTVRGRLCSRGGVICQRRRARRKGTRWAIACDCPLGSG